MPQVLALILGPPSLFAIALAMGRGVRVVGWALVIVTVAILQSAALAAWVGAPLFLGAVSCTVIAPWGAACAVLLRSNLYTNRVRAAVLALLAHFATVAVLVVVCVNIGLLPL
jgi:hypothetical protein